MHGLLQCQLQTCFGRTDGFVGEMTRFLETVDALYIANDLERVMIERSMEMNSRKLMERNQALAEAENKYRTIFENVNEGIFQSTQDGRILSANPAMAKLAGYDSPEELMREVTDIARQIWVEPSKRQELLEEIIRNGYVTNWEARFRWRDGTVAWAAINSRAVRDGNGKLLYYQGTMRDITRRKKAEAEREALQQRLLDASRQAGRAEIATGVLHNVGNVLNSVNVSVAVASERIRELRVAGLVKLAGLIGEQAGQLSRFFTEDERGRRVPEYLSALAEHMSRDQDGVLKELESLAHNVEHIKQIVTMQQGFAKAAGVAEPVEVAELIEDGLRLNAESLRRHRVTVTRQIEPLPQVMVDKHAVLQILVNLLSNAKQAMRNNPGNRAMVIRAGVSANGSRIVIEVEDNGDGIARENLTRIFSHGFTTKSDGHGFGLHTSALAAQGMGGSLVGHSDGLGKGARFTLELPLAGSRDGGVVTGAGTVMDRSGGTSMGTGMAEVRRNS